MLTLSPDEFIAMLEADLTGRPYSYRNSIQSGWAMWVCWADEMI